ncbi:MAG TPA: hypothetical protein DF296_14350 [Candidatus Margulisbacteria bacterium]|nr:MAG: hypothetical protein A2X43_06070 [Candidatus Margulisbacteria bacterium GWD2_39_127]OGI02058.1 MAG: hypothetical protein A2X42_05495 [Candidatus Margulisbacteria bacterium GWF2_38_17]OGI09290.1 MAG: hypothetical protein A2X41_09180 [Candidatus Margulisbacteria bacterium GWE2_39_32]HAR63244.1 hypothetical protein [Candidatus Margulisiibacteriota bacterium]HCT86368.1 hypothetical protein [Candidatus Margulisiibacteriota bacterium]
MVGINNNININAVKSGVNTTQGVGTQQGAAKTNIAGTCGDVAAMNDLAAVKIADTSIGNLGPKEVAFQTAAKQTQVTSRAAEGPEGDK